MCHAAPSFPLASRRPTRYQHQLMNLAAPFATCTARVIAALFLAITAAAPALGGISPAWYDGVSTQTAASLRLTLGELLYTSHVRIGYNNTWEPIRTIDQTTT